MPRFEQLMPMIEQSELDGKRRLRPCFSQILIAFLYIFGSASSVVVLTSWHNVPFGTINVARGLQSFDDKFYFDFPWEYTERFNIPIANVELNFPTIAVPFGNKTDSTIYKRCKLVYKAGNVDKFAAAVMGDFTGFTSKLVQIATDTVETKLTGHQLPTLNLSHVDPLHDISYLTSTFFLCNATTSK